MIRKQDAQLTSTNQKCAKVCQEHLDRYFAKYPDLELQKGTIKALRFLVAGDEKMIGKPEGWAAGIIYALVNRYCRPCGIPGISNADFERFFGISRSVIRKRSGQVDRALDI